LIFISAVGLAESQDAAWQPGLQLPIGSFKSNPDEPGKRHYEHVQLGSFMSMSNPAEPEMEFLTSIFRQGFLA
jgi:hypothetical protein